MQIGPQGADLTARLREKYPFDPDAALPALRSNSFFPTRFALETVCSDPLKDRITPRIATEIRRIAAQEQRKDDSSNQRQEGDD